MRRDGLIVFGSGCGQKSWSGDSERSKGPSGDAARSQSFATFIKHASQRGKVSAQVTYKPETVVFDEPATDRAFKDLATMDLTDFIKSSSGRIITGFEMRGGSFGANPSKVTGAAGDPPLALRRSIDKGMAPNPAGRRINFLEIYAGDVLAPEMQPVPQYAASLFR